MRLSRGAIRALPILGILVAGALAPAAQAAPGWSAPVGISEPGATAYEAHVAVDPKGDAVVVWQRRVGANLVIQAATRPAGGTWSAPTNLSDPAYSCVLPRVAMDAQGGAVAVWEAVPMLNTVQTSTLVPGAGWSQPVDLSDTAHNANDPEVAVDSRGDATVTWSGANAVGAYVADVVSRPAGGTWGTPVKLSSELGKAELPVVALDDRGDAVVAWEEEGGTKFVTAASTRIGGGAWGAPVVLGKPGESGTDPAVALDTAGDAVAVWTGGTSAKPVVDAAWRMSGSAAWAPPAVLSTAGEDAREPVVGVDAAGEAVAAWTEFGVSLPHIAAASASVGSSSWSAPATLSDTAEDGFEAALAVDPQGDAVVVWSEHIGTSTQVAQSARRRAGASAWSPAVDLSPPGVENWAPSVGIDTAGDAVAIWRGSDGSNSITQAATYEVEGAPSVEPPAAGAGTPFVGPPPVVAPPASPKARCPKGKALRRVKLAAKGKAKKRAKTVLRCVKPMPKHKPHRHHRRRLA